ncbi:MAG: Eco57I restriction-modification methylase domain-containing protein, partial [Verrucomicrobiaceae bacterium]
MSPEQRQEISRSLAAFDFSGLFTDPALGWDWPAATGSKLRVPYGSGFLQLDVVAEKRGVKILHCPPDAKGRVPLSDERRKIDKAVTPLASEHLLIFTDTAKTRQVWQWPARRPGKPASLRELTWEKGKSNELLFQKLASIAFALDEEEKLDITGVVRRLTDTLDRDRVTKRFYDLFKRQKDAFQKFIKGLSDTGLQAWYTSLMLNRIMFCYFLQRKGFLDGDQNYLASRLARVQDQIGKNQFHSFYRSFLRRLFHEGLGSQERSKELSELIGTIPYLNGGIFDEHPIERGNPDLSIPDEAFEKVFKFFDQFDWHLDDNPIAEGNEINPEILGYVFEKYTNQKEMGAYYTKEDITEYISKNCIIPFLVQAIADKLPVTAWQMLPANHDRYIYEAVRRGAGSTEAEWKASLPPNIAIGLDTTKPGLIKRRKDWNTTTPSSHNLSTEIWRETISRHQRCHELRAKLRAGDVKSIDDFVTLNLDIRQFAQDVIESADASLLLAFFERLKKLSVLDPTCGSGAFLFAALEILEPLYTACIQRFRAILADWQSTGEKHPNWEKDIKAILDHAAAHPNEGYYIHKTIIVHNLYGVDIMEEAVEICKLRLFLKLAAQLEPGQQVEPLPDIDFNIRAGNTLVGYATRDEVRRAFTEHQGGSTGSQLLLGGIEHNLDDYRRIEEQAEDADRAFQRFHQLQESTKMDAAEFRSAKQSLHDTLKIMRDQLDRFLAGDYDKAKHLKTDAAFEKWRKSHQPFHWFIEFYGIMNKGGFDV